MVQQSMHGSRFDAANLVALGDGRCPFPDLIGIQHEASSLLKLPTSVTSSARAALSSRCNSWTWKTKLKAFGWRRMLPNVIILCCMMSLPGSSEPATMQELAWMVRNDLGPIIFV